MESYIKKKGIKLDEHSFEECFIDIGKAQHNIDFCEQFPALKQWAEFHNFKGKYKTNHLTNNKAIRFIVGMYDPKSPFVLLVTNAEERKLLAAEHAGFEISDSGVFQEYAQEVMQNQVPIIVKMILTYCKNVHSTEYATYVRFQMMYYEKLENQGPKPATIQELDRELKTLNEYRDIILAMDSHPRLVKGFYKIITDSELEVRKYRPEFLIASLQAKYGYKTEETEEAPKRKSAGKAKKKAEGNV